MRKLGAATLAVVAGRTAAPGAPLSAPPVFASSFRDGGAHGYARGGNPTWEAFEDAVAALERAADAVAFGSGMAAAAALLATLPEGALVHAADSAHVEVRGLLAARAAEGRLGLKYGDPLDPQAFGAARADAIWVDSITNPSLDVVDLRAIAAARGGASLFVDGTLATPILQRPLALGADAVLHSATKHIGGHSDLLLGVVATREPALGRRLRELREETGSVPGTMEAWLALRGMRTLALRIERGQAGAILLAERLRVHPEVRRVRYPGLAGEPSHDTAERVLRGPGSMLAFEVEGGARRADRLCAELELIVHAGSLGGVETTIERHARWHDELSVPEELLRLSVGCEDAEDLWRDLDFALSASRGAA